MAAMPQVQTPKVVGRIESIKVKTNHSCSGCKKSIDKELTEGQTTKCPFCEMRQRTSSLKKTTFAKMCIKEGDYDFYNVTCFALTMNHFFATAEGKENWQVEALTSDEIEEFFLSSPALCFDINKVDNVVLKFQMTQHNCFDACISCLKKVSFNL